MRCQALRVHLGELAHVTRHGTSLAFCVCLLYSICDSITHGNLYLVLTHRTSMSADGTRPRLSQLSAPAGTLAYLCMRLEA